jgi:hypothetical protein
LQIDIVSVVLIAMWLCLVGTLAVYTLRARSEGNLRLALIGGLVAVTFAAGYAAHRSLAQLGPSIPRQARLTQVDVNRIPIDRAPPLGAIDRTELRLPRFIDVAGWIADSIRRQPGAGVFILIDGTHAVRGVSADYGRERHDVARAFDDADLLWVGFGIRYLPVGLTPGDHYLQIAIVSDDLTRAYVLPQGVAFSIR